MSTDERLAAQDDATRAGESPGRPPFSSAGPTRRRKRRGRWVWPTIAAAAAIVAAFFGVPWLIQYMRTVSTDDAYVRGHATIVSPRVSGIVTQVLVDENDRITPGMMLVRLDPEPYRVIVQQRQAALAQAKLTVDRLVATWKTSQAALVQAKAQVAADVANLDGARFQIVTARDNVRATVATLESDVATLKLQQANLVFAQDEYARYQLLVKGGYATKEELEQQRDTLDVTQQQVAVAEHNIQQTRAQLGLAADREHPESVPEDLERTFPAVRSALAAAQQILGRLGIAVAFEGKSLDEIVASLGTLNYGSVVDQVPAVRVAQAQVDESLAALGESSFNPEHPYEHPTVVEAERNLAEAQLNLSYTEIKSSISGYVSSRSVNPGDYAQPSQSMLAVQPLDGVWVDANFKETQIHHMRVGQPVNLYVDAYPNRVFKGRVAGFRAATGATLSLLPPENATGNFVKIVQRIPVRIELTEPNPPETPLLVGLSVVPEVLYREQPTGPDAGKMLLPTDETDQQVSANR